MAKFIPTVNLWNPAIDTALRNGQLKLQRGQWVQCGDGPKSRFLELTHTGGTIRCVHGKDVAEVNARFKSIVTNHYKPLCEFESRMAALRAERKAAKTS